MKYFTKLLIIIFVAVALVSCEKQEYFKSESEVKKELAHTWQEILMVRKYNSSPFMIWKFMDDSLIIERTSDSLVAIGAAPMSIFRGTYSVRTTLTKVFVTTSDFADNAAWYWLNAEWTVVGLDNKGLVIASEDPHAGGINEREFKRLD